MKTFKGNVLFLDRSDINTDEIIPAKYLTEITKEALKPNLLEDLVLPGFSRADTEDKAVIVTRENFGCGSSREHAPWALAEYGFRAIIAPSFADIFYNNSFKNGLLPIVLDKAAIDTLFTQCDASEGYTLHIDLDAQTVTRPDGVVHGFDVDAFRKHCLLNGLDDIGLTLNDRDAIHAFEARHRAAQPWLFEG